MLSSFLCSSLRDRVSCSRRCMAAALASRAAVMRCTRSRMADLRPSTCSRRSCSSARGRVDSDVLDSARAKEACSSSSRCLACEAEEPKVACSSDFALRHAARASVSGVVVSNVSRAFK
jgi:hypothetical protein